MVSLIAAFSLSEIVFHAMQGTVHQTSRCAAFGAAFAGLERAKLVVAESDVFSSGVPILFSGSLSNADYSVDIASLGDGEVSVVSTGTSGNTDCVLGRTATAQAEEVTLRGVHYVGSYSVNSGATMEFMTGHEPLHSSTRPETPDYDYYRQLAVSGGHYYSGNKTLSGTLANGFYFIQGNLTIAKNTVLASGTLVALGGIEINKNCHLANSGWEYPVLLAGGSVSADKSCIITGVIYSGGTVSFDKDVHLTGRIDSDSVAIQKDVTVTDNGNENVYRELSGFTYAEGSGGGGGVGQLTFSGWSEAYSTTE